MVWQFFKTVNMELPQDPAIPLLGIYLKELKAELEQMFLERYSQ